MKIVVKSPLRDTISFVLSLKKRDRLFKKAVSPPAGIAGQGPAPMNRLAGQLHPRGQLLRISEVRQETPTTRTYRLESVEEGHRPAFFRAGQYIAVEDGVNGSSVSRPFSISSSPDEAMEKGFYEITVKTDGANDVGDSGAKGGGNGMNDGSGEGFFAPWSAREWKPGKILQCSEPMGTFYYEPLRDAPHLVCLAGGSGITPFRSILKYHLEHDKDLRFTLLYGVTEPGELIFGEELKELERIHPDRFTLVRVFSESGETEAESGFITSKLIRKYVPAVEEASFFICGPPAMYEFVAKELESFSLPRKRMRREHYGCSTDVSAGKKIHTVTVLGDVGAGYHGRTGSRGLSIPAKEGETVLVALERAGLNPPALCRSGECGWCRSRLVSGEIHVPPENDGRRKADLKFGWFHPCSSFPRSDLTIEVPRNPLKRR